MSHGQTADRWIDRINRAAQLLGDRLDDPPGLLELANAASVSPFHFHRIWRAMTGETVAGSVTRLRLEAAKTMLADGAGVTATSLASGFATSQSFARAFRRGTGQTPTEWRNGDQATLASRGAGGAVDIVWRDAVTVVALRREGQPYEDLNATFGVIWNWAQEAGVLDRLSGIYGMPLDDPQSVPVEGLRYEAALAVGPASPPAPLSVRVLPGGRFAQLRLEGPYGGLEAATQALVGDWLLQSGEEPADSPVLYSFLNDPDETPEPDLLTDILLLLKDPAS